MSGTIIGILGCGNIAKIIVKAVIEGRLDVEIGALYDLQTGRAKRLAKAYGKAVHTESFEEFMAADTTMVVEAASIEAIEEFGEEIVAAGKDLVVLSVGALMKKSVRRGLERAAKKAGARVIIPSGAIGGLDLLKAAAVEGIDEIVLTTIKNPRSLPGKGPGRRKVVFEGDVEDAVRLFPKNINVAAALAIASESKLKVMIVSDPTAETNRHEVLARGAFGEMRLVVSNVPSPDNPKTSYLAALSVIRAIQGVEGSLVIGT